MDIIAIINAIIKALEVLAPIIADCFEPTPEGAQEFRRQSVRAYRMMFRQLRKQGLTRSDAMKGARMAVYDLQMSSDDEVCELIEDSRSLAAGNPS